MTEATTPLTLQWDAQAWENYQRWVRLSPAAHRWLNDVLRRLALYPSDRASGCTELIGELQGYWSRRIDWQRRLVYTVQKGQLVIVQCDGPA